MGWAGDGSCGAGGEAACNSNTPMPYLRLASGMRLYYEEINPRRRQAILMLHGMGTNDRRAQVNDDA